LPEAKVPRFRSGQSAHRNVAYRDARLRGSENRHLLNVDARPIRVIAALYPTIQIS